MAYNQHHGKLYNLKLKIGGNDFSTHIDRTYILSSIQRLYPTFEIILRIQYEVITTVIYPNINDIELEMSMELLSGESGKTDKIKLMFINDNITDTVMSQPEQDGRFNLQFITYKFTCIPSDSYKYFSKMINKSYHESGTKSILNDITNGKEIIECGNINDTTFEQFFIPPMTRGEALYYLNCNAILFKKAPLVIFNNPFEHHKNKLYIGEVAHSKLNDDRIFKILHLDNSQVGVKEAKYQTFPKNNNPNTIEYVADDNIHYNDTQTLITMSSKYKNNFIYKPLDELYKATNKNYSDIFKDAVGNEDNKRYHNVTKHCKETETNVTTMLGDCDFKDDEYNYDNNYLMNNLNNQHVVQFSVRHGNIQDFIIPGKPVKLELVEDTRQNHIGNYYLYSTSIMLYHSKTNYTIHTNGTLARGAATVKQKVTGMVP